MHKLIISLLDDMAVMYRTEVAGWPQLTTKKGWLPGGEKRTPEFAKMVFDTLRLKEPIGVTGRVYQSIAESQEEQGYQQHWVAIDIDHDDNPNLDPAQVAELLPEASIRFSKSGKGLHGFFKLAEPIQVQQGYKLNITRILSKYRSRLRANGVIPCQAHSLNFWVFGGLQKWYKRTNQSIAININELEEISMKVSFSASGNNWILSTLDPAPRRLYTILMEKGIIPNSPLVAEKYQIVSKHVYQALKGTPFEFETCSPMRNNDFNGFISCDGVNVGIFICADNKFVKQYMCGFDVQKQGVLI